MFVTVEALLYLSVPYSDSVLVFFERSVAVSFSYSSEYGTSFATCRGGMCYLVSFPERIPQVESK